MVPNSKQPTHIHPLGNTRAESYIRATCPRSLCPSQLSAPEVGRAWEKMVEGEKPAKSKCKEKEESAHSSTYIHFQLNMKPACPRTSTQGPCCRSLTLPDGHTTAGLPKPPGTESFLADTSENLPVYHPGCSSPLTILLVVKKRLGRVPFGPKVIVHFLAKRGGGGLELELQAVEKVGGSRELGSGGWGLILAKLQPQCP